MFGCSWSPRGKLQVLLAVVQSLSCVRLFATPWTAGAYLSLNITSQDGPFPQGLGCFWANGAGWPSEEWRFGKTQLHWKNPPGGASGKEPACQCRRCRRPWFDPWVGKIPWRRACQPIPVFLPKESHGQKSLAGHSPGGHKESDPTERLSIHTASLRWCVSLPGWQNKILQTGGLNNRSLFSHSSGSWKSEMRVLSELVSDETSFPGLQTVAFFRCPHLASCLCPQIPGVPFS